MTLLRSAGKPVFEGCRPLEQKERDYADAALQHRARFFPSDTDGAWPPRKEAEVAQYFRSIYWDPAECGEGGAVEESGLVFAGRRGAEAWVRAEQPMPAPSREDGVENDRESMVSYWRIMVRKKRAETLSEHGRARRCLASPQSSPLC